MVSSRRLRCPNCVTHTRAAAISRLHFLANLAQLLVRGSEAHPPCASAPDNELIFDPTPWIDGLPGSIEAFFLPPWSSPADVASTVRAHATFMRDYASDVPLLNYDPSDRHEPFKLRNSSRAAWCVRVSSLKPVTFSSKRSGSVELRMTPHARRCRPGSNFVMRRGMNAPPCGRLVGIQQRLAQLASQLINSTAQHLSTL